MAAATQEINQPILVGYYTIEHPTIAANAKVFAGTLCMNDAGAVKPAATGVAGSLLLGIAQRTTDNAAGGAPLTPDLPMIFLKGTFGEFDGKAGDLPIAADLGKAVAIEDDSTVKRTFAANDLPVTLVAILGGSRFRVWIP